MKSVFLNGNIKKIHFIGIGGISMSGLAEILHSNGYIISGSDSNISSLTDHILQIGINFTHGHKQENIHDDMDLVVHTAAVKEDNPEIIEARKKQIPIIDRAKLLGQIMRSYTNAISITGTHGKTTTTSMVSEILLNADCDPTISLGGVLQSINGNFRMGNSEFFVVESCEYCDSFLNFYPKFAIVLNIEEDHLDYFRNLDHIQASFNKFSCNISTEGYLIINKNIKNFDNVIKNVKCNIISYGTKDSNWYFDNVIYNNIGMPSFDVLLNNKIISNVSLNIIGHHNILNALSAFACCYYAGVDPDKISEGLSSFKGVKRRYEVKGSFNGVTVIDDYAHHPTEVKTTLSALPKNKYNKIFCVFQPHTYTRTKKLFNEFAASFDDADEIIIIDIYSAREIDLKEVHSRDLATAIKRRGKSAHYFENLELVENFLRQKCYPNDLLITMGAGDVYLLGEKMLTTDLSTLSTI